MDYSLLGNNVLKDHSWPTAGLAMDKAGNLYGTTPNGSPWSTVFELTPDSGGWKETVLYRFCMSNPVCVDGTCTLCRA